MHKLKLLLTTAATTFVALAAVSATANAFRVSVSAGGAISAVSLGNVTFEGGVSIECPITLNGRILTSATIVAGTRLGEITEVRINNAMCTGGSFRSPLVSAGAPWPIKLNSVPAGLPSEVASFEILLEGAAFQLAVFGGFINCLYRGNSSANLSVATTRTVSVYTTGLVTILASRGSLIEGGFGCPGSASGRGTFSLTVQTVTIS